MKQRLLGLAAFLGLVALIVGVPWLLVSAAIRVQLRFDMATMGGWWEAVTTRDDGTLLVWVVVVLGGILWTILAVALLVEIVARIRRTPVPDLRGLGLPQTIVRGLVSATIGAVLATHTTTTAGPAIAAPGAVPVHTLPAPATPVADKGQDDPETYVVRKGDTLWDIADEELGDPYAYPDIYAASKHTTQPDGRHLTDPDLIYPGWELTIPTDGSESDQPAAKPAATAPVETPPPTPAAATPITPRETTTPILAGPSTAAQPDISEQAAPGAQSEQPDTANPLPWLLTGLAGAGGLLAGSLWLALRRRRAAQFRYRRPGRTITTPPPDLAPVEKTLSHQGGPTTDVVLRIDETLRRLAATLLGTDQSIPALLGVDATDTDLTIRLAEPADLPEPWQPGADRTLWRVPADTDPGTLGTLIEDGPPPWPQLVTIGQDAQGWRLLNLETLGVVTLTGDPAYAEDLARAMVCELAVAPWARDVLVDLHKVFHEVGDLNPVRLDRRTTADIIDQLVTAAIQTHDYLSVEGVPDVTTGRATQAGAELWLSRLLVTRDAGLDHLGTLAGLVTSQPGRTGTAILTLAAGASNRQNLAGVEVQLANSGRVRVPGLGLDLVAAGLTREESIGCVAVLAAANVMDDREIPVPNEPAQAWQGLCNDAGQLRADLTIPRGSRIEIRDASTLLAEPDKVYLDKTANTAHDLATLAPNVPAETTRRARAADPTLDSDLAAWWSASSERPRLSVLGPVKLRVGPGGKPTEAADRLDFYTEVAAYLATMPNGATAEELAAALGLGINRVRRDLSVVRLWLGTNPRTGRLHLPEARRHPRAQEKGVGVYLIEDLLFDADLFRRLRVRGESGGPDGMHDLSAALRLVTGPPYQGLRRKGGLWLRENRLDHHMHCAIVDVAHLVYTRAMADNDLLRARWASELGAVIAPDEISPKLDLASVAAREGRGAEAAAAVRAIVDWRDGNGEGPPDLSARATAIMRIHDWFEHSESAS